MSGFIAKNRGAIGRERLELQELSGYIPALRHASETTSRERQEIDRCLIERVEFAVNVTDHWVDVAIRWAGGFESRHEMIRPELGVMSSSTI